MEIKVTQLKKKSFKKTNIITFINEQSIYTYI